MSWNRHAFIHQIYFHILDVKVKAQIGWGTYLPAKVQAFLKIDSTVPSNKFTQTYWAG